MNSKVEYKSLIMRLDDSITPLNSRIRDASYCAIDQNATRVLLDCIDVLEDYARGFQDEVVSLIAAELYEFQEATGCDTAMEFRSALKHSDQKAEPVAYRKKVRMECGIFFTKRLGGRTVLGLNHYSPSR